MHQLFLRLLQGHRELFVHNEHVVGAWTEKQVRVQQIHEVEEVVVVRWVKEAGMNHVRCQCAREMMC